MNYGIVLFKTTATAMTTEKLLTNEGYSVSIVPTPKEFAADGCTISVRFPWSQGEAIKEKIKEAAIDVRGFREVKS